jgi:AraC family transcriptional regulator
MSDLEVRIVKLEPLRVASFHGFGASPETEAGNKLLAWAKPKGLLDDPAQHRVFGFNNPDPSPGSPNYGYELWIAVGSEVSPEDGVKIKEFAGGLYAVTRCEVKDDPYDVIPVTWQRLVAWCEDSKYRMAHHQWLEEHLDVAHAWPGAFTLDLYLPIAE